jgi:alpha-N-arabinofuranosidase
MRQAISMLLMLVVSISINAQGYTNPVIKGFNPDPSVCRVGDDYYLVTSSFQYFPGVPLYHSKDLVNWEQIGHVLTRESQLYLKGANSGGGIYAPTIRHHNGKFYMITTNVSTVGNFIVTTEDICGEWSDPIPVKVGGIDPSLFWDEDGKCWYTGSADGGIVLCEVNPDTGEVLSTPKRVWDGTGGRWPEAPHIYKKDGWYYLMIAEGGTEFGHNETIARSRHIEGPYDPAPHNPILAHYKAATQTNPIQGVGHADLVQAHDGSWWLVCLGFRTQSGMHHLLGRETFLAPVRWDEGAWPVVNGTGDIALDMNVSTLPQKPFPARPDRYEFDEEKLGNEWSWLRNPDMSNYALENGCLRLYGTDTDLNLLSESPTFVGLRQQDISFTAETCVKLKKARNDDKAGVTVFMDSGAHYDIYLVKKGANWYVGVRYAMGVLNHVEEELAGGSKVYFRITGDPDFYRFWYSEDGKEYKQLGVNHTRYLSSETIGGFTGIMLGLWAQSQSEKGWAEFEYFEYK